MVDNALCKYCTERDKCYTAEGQVHNLACSGKHGNDMFIPNKDVEKYFQYVYVGNCGRRGHIYDFKTTNESLLPTHAIRIGYGNYCPYCGEQMYSIQEKVTLAVIGHCCICEGARAELEYEKEKKQLIEQLDEERRQKMAKLQKRYEKSLAYDTDKLIKIKLEVDESNMRDHLGKTNHFAQSDEKPYTNIEDFL